MKHVSFLLLFIAFGAPEPPQPAIAYFTNVREVKVQRQGRQNYFLVDEELWSYSRPDLGDLRLYDGASPVQYFVSEQSAGVSSEEVEAKILNLGSVSGHTEFDLDAQKLATYDRVHLRLDAKDFVATASVAGANAPNQASWTDLRPSTLYDFTREQLGSNSVLKLPPSSFRYLHIKLSRGLVPNQIKSAAIYNLREQVASWTKVGSCSAPQQKPRTTVIVCNAPPRVPLNRILLQVAPSQVNFRRVVSVLDARGIQQTSGEISRVRVNRAGTLVTAEELSVGLLGTFGQFTLSVDNEDNPPLAILEAQPQSLERRVYFDPQGKASLRLYYGDEKLSAPVYDYARFFHLDASLAQAQLAPGTHNPQYTGRPDDRPWSERHMGILWTVMILAVTALALLAIRGLRSEATR